MKTIRRFSALVLSLLVLTSALLLPAAAQEHIKLYLDGKITPITPEARDGRTMIPIRSLSELLGAAVEWDQGEQRVTITRAGVTVIMTLGKTTAYVNGKPVEMDVAPYANDRSQTLIPARYLAEFFGQKVDWDSEKQAVFVIEDKSAAGSSNLESWALPMGAMLNKINGLYPTIFGSNSRSVAALVSVTRHTLNGGSWTIPDRADLIGTVLSMTVAGHNGSFQEAAAIVSNLTDTEYQELLSQSGKTDAYMWPYTKALSAKWGDRGILCWDLFRMSNLVQWGYVAGYLTYPEALALLEPAVILLKENFTSWDEAYENYLDGYNWWARNDVGGKHIWETERGKLYTQMKADPETGPIFNEALFTQDIIPVPGVTYEDLMNEFVNTAP